MRMMTAVITLALLAPSAFALDKDPDFFVAAGGNDTWSGRMPDPSDDDADGPFASLQRAQTAIRDWIASGEPGHATVTIRAGKYYLPGGLDLTAADSAPDKSITWRAHPGEDVTLIGGQPLTFDSADGDILQATISNAAEIPVILEDGYPLRLARSPNAGYYKTDRPVAGMTRKAFTIREGDLEGGWTPDFARVAIWPGHNWFRHTKDLSEYDAEGRRIVMANENGYPMIGGDRYFVENVPEFLDAPGEYTVNPRTGEVRILPRDSQSELTLLTASHLLTLEGENDGFVRNIRFEDITFEGANGVAVQLTNAQNCTFLRCRVISAGGSGISISGHSRGNTVESSEIAWNGGHGVSLEGYDPGGPPLHGEHAVVNNVIHHNGWQMGHGYGIVLVGTHNNRIEHNHIHHQPRYAVTIKGRCLGPEGQDFGGVHYSQVTGKALIHSRNNRISWNYIHHVNLDSQDTGAIETWGPGVGNVIEYNYIHDVGNHQFDIMSGIYLDDAADYYIVHHNVIRNVIGTRHVQGIYTKGIGNIIDNNIFFVGDGDYQSISSLEMASQMARTHHYTHNIHVFEGDSRTLYRFDSWSDDRVATSDYNLFFTGGAALNFRGLPAGDDFETWRGLFDGKFDAHSQFGDPLFVDPDKGDFRFRPDSPAWSLGIEPVDLRTAGVNSENPYREQVLVHTELLNTANGLLPSDSNSATLELVLDNPDSHPVTTEYDVRVWPPNAASVEGGPHRTLLAAPERKTTEEIVLRRTSDSRSFRVEAAARSSVLESPWVDVEFAQAVELNRINAGDLEETRNALAKQKPFTLRSTPSNLGELRFAVAGKNLAVNALVHEASFNLTRNHWDGTCVEIFGAMPGGAIGQIFLVPGTDDRPAQAVVAQGPKVPIPVTSTPASDGYDLTALIPLTSLKIDPSSDHFLLEASINTVPPGSHTRLRSTVFGSQGAFNNNERYGRVTVK